MEMARYSPPPGEQQERPLLLAFSRAVRSMYKAWPSAPNLTVSVSLSDPFSLAVGVIINEDAQGAQNKYKRGQRRAQGRWMADEVECVAGIQARKEDETAPALEVDRKESFSN